MNLLAALLKITEFTKSGEEVDICKYRYGNLLIDLGKVQRGLRRCQYCGALIPMGVIAIAHKDGRAVRFNAGLYHHAQAGHPLPWDVSKEMADQIVAIVSDVCNECGEEERESSTGPQ